MLLQFLLLFCSVLVTEKCGKNGCFKLYELYEGQAIQHGDNYSPKTISETILSLIRDKRDNNHRQTTVSGTNSNNFVLHE
jgi:hypothetical protein